MQLRQSVGSGPLQVRQRLLHRAQELPLKKRSGLQQAPYDSLPTKNSQLKQLFIAEPLQVAH